MEYVAIGLCLIAIIAIGVIIYQRKRKEATTENTILHQEESNLYFEDVQLIAKDGKIFYLPGSIS